MLIRLIQPHTALVECPYLDEDLGDIILVFNERLPKVLTKVLQVYKCDELEVGDEIMFNPNAINQYLLADGSVIYAIDERSASTVI